MGAGYTHLAFWCGGLYSAWAQGLLPFLLYRLSNFAAIPWKVEAGTLSERNGGRLTREARCLVSDAPSALLMAKRFGSFPARPVDIVALHAIDNHEEFVVSTSGYGCHSPDNGHDVTISEGQ